MALQGALQHHRTFSSQRMKSATSMNGWPHLLLSYSRTSSLMHCPDPFKMIYYLYRSSSAVYAHIKSGNILNSAYQLRSFPELVCASVALLHPPSSSMCCPDPFKKMDLLSLPLFFHGFLPPSDGFFISCSHGIKGPGPGLGPTRLPPECRGVLLDSTPCRASRGTSECYASGWVLQ